MKTLNIQVIRVQYSALSGLAWLVFWTFLAFFMGVMMQWWTLESNTAHWWWIASAVMITVRRPFKTITVMSINLPLEKKDPAS